MRILYLSLIVLALFACKSQKTITNAGPKSSKNINNNDSAIIILNRTPCYGRCPWYTLSIYPNGKVKFVGQRFVTKVGVYEKNISKPSLDSLTNAIEAADIWKLADSYPERNTDAPGTNLQYRNNGKTKTIKGIFQSPDKYREAIQKLYELGDSEGWTKTGELPTQQQ